MSMNLKCKEIELWQTPTHIAYMCYSNKDGGWEGILYRYIQWVSSHISGTFKRRQDLNDITSLVRDHIISLRKLAKKEKLNFYIE